MDRGSIEAVARHLAAGDPHRALVAVRSLWNEVRDPDLIALMEALNVAAPRSAVVARGKEARSAAFARRAARDDPADLPVLIDEIAARVHPADDGARIRALAPRTPDPRLGPALVRIVETIRNLTPSNQRFVLSAAEQVARVGEPGSIAALRSWISTHHRLQGVLRRTVFEHLNAADKRAKGRSLNPLPDQLVAGWIAEVALRSTPPPTVEALWEAVYADPADDGARWVLADRLVEDGDPRGEFISLQLERDRQGRPKPRERALLKEWEGHWLQPFAGLIAPGSARWAGGFVCEAAAPIARELPPRKGLLAPQWATLEAIDLGTAGHQNGLDLLREAPLRSLARVDGVHAGWLEALGTRPWTHLGLLHCRRAADLDRLVQFPNLRTLGLSWSSDVGRAAAHPAVAALDEIVVAPIEAGGLSDLVRAHGVRFRYTADAWTFAVFPSPDGTVVEARYSGRRRKDASTALERQIKALGYGKVARFRVVDAGSAQLDAQRLTIRARDMLVQQARTSRRPTT